MNVATAERPPYAAAVAVGFAVLVGYVLTLAPTVTFWDAGEFIAAAKTLGIPHPPGTPLFVLLAHVWGTLVPVGEFAYRTNLLSAAFSAAAAACLFLVAHESVRAITRDLEAGTARVLAVAGAAAAAIIGAFTFTNWQNSNETEVYSVATFTVAAVAWLCFRWRAARGTPRATRHLLLIVYLAGLSIGNHLLALLAGPAIVGFLAMTLRLAPATDARVRRQEWGHVAVVAGVWALLIGTGLGSTTLAVVGAAFFAATAAFAAANGGGRFALIALALGAVGLTPYLFLYLRSAQSPIINEAAPSTLDALMAVIRRAQYPPRTPLDDPTVPHGPDNPGRTLTLLGMQLTNYFQYYDWQWARSLGLSVAGVPLRVVATIGFTSLALVGCFAQRRADRAAWWQIFLLWLVTGLGLVVYMNFKPGFSLFYDQYPSPGDHEVRERDYFFVLSFVTAGLWAGLGAAELARRLVAGRKLTAPIAAVGIAAVALVPVLANWTSASRRHGADVRLAADFAYNLLNTVPPHGVLFTYGDNDTFPLWWAQEVEGIRRDVTVVCLALANTEWYIRQLRDNPDRPVDVARLPEIWRDQVGVQPPAGVHSMTDNEVASAAQGSYIDRDQRLRLGPLTAVLSGNRFLYPNEIASLRIVQENAGKRPIVWAVTAGGEFLGLDPYVVQQGLGYALRLTPADTADPKFEFRRLGGQAPLDVPTTAALAWDTYRYGHLLDRDVARLESTSASIASSMALPFAQLAYAYEARGDTAAMVRALERAVQLSPNPALRTALDELRLQNLGLPDGSDTAGGSP